MHLNKPALTGGPVLHGTNGEEPCPEKHWEIHLAPNKHDPMRNMGAMCGCMMWCVGVRSGSACQLIDVDGTRRVDCRRAGLFCEPCWSCLLMSNAHQPRDCKRKLKCAPLVLGPQLGEGGKGKLSEMITANPSPPMASL